MPPTDQNDAAAVAAATRRVIAAVVRAGDAIAADAHDLSTRLHAIADRIDGAAPPLPRRMAEMWQPDLPRRHNPVTGTANALAPPLLMAEEPDGSGAVRGAVSFGLPYQGPPGQVHGGMSALLLDHVLGLATMTAGQRAMTATLRLTYHQPLPLFREATVTGRHVSTDGRKIRSVGMIETADGTHVSAEGLFVAVRPAAD